MSTLRYIEIKTNADKKKYSPPNPGTDEFYDTASGPESYNWYTWRSISDRSDRYAEMYPEFEGQFNYRRLVIKPLKKRPLKKKKPKTKVTSAPTITNIEF